ncbi:phosphotransferase enzyme family protein [Brachybacterium hainanense]|uniref:Phosphotransferase enzyme family protein n=1 Tax=Brachybacterium hainanense TaxID=1541174 RepID=A0ABV6RHT4_9MICO
MNSLTPEHARRLALETVRATGLAVGAARVLHTSNTVIVHVEPADVVARVGPASPADARREVAIAHALARAGAPVVAPLPREEPMVREAEGFTITLWEHRPGTGEPIGAQQYAQALHRAHAAMRELDVDVPEASSRVDEALALLADPERSPRLRADDRALLEDTLRELRPLVAEASAPQLLHGEPHPGNLLATASGAVLLDFETCCRGPVEFDLAHAPQPVAAFYPGADAELVGACRRLVLAMVTTWRFDREDSYPDGLAAGEAWLAALRAGRDPFRDGPGGVLAP